MAPVRWNYFDINNGAKNNVLMTYQIHPDENDAQDQVMEGIERLATQKGMPNILFVPIGSPTGYARLAAHYQEGLPKNVNGMGNDLNWSFFNDSQDPEVLAWMELLRGRKFDYSLHIHHDYEMVGKYFYGYHHTKTSCPPLFDWHAFIGSLSRMGFETYADHYDDLEHPALGHWIPKDGLITLHPQPQLNGSFENYLVTHDKVERGAFTFELPNGLKKTEYNSIVRGIYTGLLNQKTGFVLPTSSPTTAPSSTRKPSTET